MENVKFPTYGASLEGFSILRSILLQISPADVWKPLYKMSLIGRLTLKNGRDGMENMGELFTILPECVIMSCRNLGKAIEAKAVWTMLQYQNPMVSMLSMRIASHY